jgi:hypothetical protein
LVKVKNLALYILVLISASLITTTQVYLTNDSTAFNENLNSSLNETQSALANDENSSFDKFLNFLTLNYDPITSVLVSLIYMYFFGKVIRKAYHLLSQAVPSYVNISEIKEDLKLMVC